MFERAEVLTNGFFFEVAYHRRRRLFTFARASLGNSVATYATSSDDTTKK